MRRCVRIGRCKQCAGVECDGDYGRQCMLAAEGQRRKILAV